MKTRLKIGITFLLTIVVLFAWHGVAFLLNYPGDFAAIGGAVGVVAFLVFVPTAYWRIWRKKNNESQEKPVA